MAATTGCGMFGHVGRAVAIVAVVITAGVGCTSSTDDTSSSTATTTSRATSIVEPAPTPPTTDGGLSDDGASTSDPPSDVASPERAELAAYAREFDLTVLPQASEPCEAWFDAWSEAAIDAEFAAATLDDATVVDAVASHRAAAAAGVADCIEGRSVDRAALEAEQARLTEVLG